MEPKISFGNKKLPKDTMIFNLPAVTTCPGKTDFCAKNCYALKAERMYKAVLPARKHNAKLSTGKNFVEMMCQVITRNAHKIKRVRIHESGDFYGQAYLSAWFSIASRFPEITFYAYTKSFDLDFTGKPKNFVLIASFDNSTTLKAKILYAIKKEAFDNTFTIVGKNENADCIQDCTKCDVCWADKGKNITVNLH